MEGPVIANDIMEGSIMLVLSRKVGESILISESIRVTVVGSRNGQIRLGIEAPPEVTVLREELTRSCSNSSPSKNGEAEALPSSNGQIRLGIEAPPEGRVLREELRERGIIMSASSNRRAHAQL